MTPNCICLCYKMLKQLTKNKFANSPTSTGASHASSGVQRLRCAFLDLKTIRPVLWRNKAIMTTGKWEFGQTSPWWYKRMNSLGRPRFVYQIALVSLKLPLTSIGTCFCDSFFQRAPFQNSTSMRKPYDDNICWYWQDAIPQYSWHD